MGGVAGLAAAFPVVAVLVVALVAAVLLGAGLAAGAGFAPAAVGAFLAGAFVAVVGLAVSALVAFADDGFGTAAFAFELAGAGVLAVEALDALGLDADALAGFSVSEVAFFNVFSLAVCPLSGFFAKSPSHLIAAAALASRRNWF